VIEVRELRKAFGPVTALAGISFSVAKGETFGFLGPNGAGKTTAIRILTGRLKADSGTSSVLGQEPSSGTREIIGRIGVVPEETNLYERLTVRQNLEFFCRLFGAPFTAIDPYLEETGLAGHENRPVKKLSKGMKQRALLVRALLHGPEILFLDEPTSGLDPVSAAGIHKILKRLAAEGVTIFLTSHNMEEVDFLCGRVAFLDRGFIVEQGVPSELKLKFGLKEMEAVVGNGGALERRRLPLAGAESAAAISGWIASGNLKSVHSCEPTLADIFRKVTGRELS
jgi:ABC-2 type transport system ATP-binding protein